MVAGGVLGDLQIAAVGFRQVAELGMQPVGQPLGFGRGAQPRLAAELAADEVALDAVRNLEAVGGRVAFVDTVVARDLERGLLVRLVVVSDPRETGERLEFFRGGSPDARDSACRNLSQPARSDGLPALCPAW